jgi:hypothetical protein
MRDIACDRSAAEVFGSKLYAAVLLTGIPVVILAGYELGKHLSKIWPYPYCIYEALVPSLLLVWIFAGWRLVRPDSMLPVLQPSSDPILRMRRLGAGCTYIALAGVIVPFVFTRYRLLLPEPQLGFRTLPEVLLNFAIPAILARTYVRLRTPNQGIAFHSGKLRAASLVVLAVLTAVTGAITVYTWGSLWGIAAVLMALLCGQLFLALLRQQAYQPPGEPEAGSEILQPMPGDSGPNQGSQGYGFTVLK